MENPFPGVDPWMEEQWGDTHARLIIYAADQIRPRLPPDLKARAEERVYLAELPRVHRATRQPDLRIVQMKRARPSEGGIATAAPKVAAATPYIVSLASDEVTESFIEVRERRPSNRLITVIEVLSPANKHAGMGRKKYLAKQSEYLRAGVNLVEIDLLRGGRWTVVAPSNGLPRDMMNDAAYRVSVWRAASPEDAEFFPIRLREPLPAINVPLRPADPDVLLELQPLLNQVYVAGDYADTDYEINPKPRLSRADAEWADTILRSKGLRGNRGLGKGSDLE